MNSGITLAYQGQRLIGSGVALTYDETKMRLPAPFEGAVPDGTAAVPAGTAPIITNLTGDGVNSGDGITMAASNTEVAGVTVSGATRNGIYAIADATTPVATLDNLRIRNSVVALSGLHGIYVLAKNAGRVSTPEISNATTHNNTQHGIWLYSYGAGSSLSDAKVQDSESYSNALHGLYVYAASGGSVSAPELANVSTRNNYYGIYLCSNGAGSTLSNAKVMDSESYNNAYYGLHLYALVGGNISAPEIANVTTRDNSQAGMYIRSNGTDSMISNAKVRDSESYGNAMLGMLVHAHGGAGISAPEIANVTTRNNTQHGIGLRTDNAGSILPNARVRDSESYGNTWSGLWIFLSSGSSVSAPEIENVSTHNNTQYGMYFYSTGASSSLTGANVHDSSVTANGYSGLYFQAASSGALGAKVATTTSTGNTQNGVYADDDTSAAYTLDLGGGTLGSTGHNRIYGNTGTDLRVDLDGLQLKAQSNWWGNASGLLPARTTLEVSSTVDSSSFLATDPAP